MKNIIICEGETDKKFLEGYIAYLQTTFPKEYLFIDGIKAAKGQDAITAILKAQQIAITIGETKNIGILLDADEEGITAKIAAKINPAIEKAFGQKNVIKAPNEKTSVAFGGNTVNIFCYIFNMNGKGELEDILKEIRTDKNTETTVCLDKFIECMEGCNEAYPVKTYKKNFIYFYGYDCIRKEGLKSEDIKSKLKNYGYYTHQYWNFEHGWLSGLKQFLSLFQ
jgi:5S rRNA maturation endonuclease (ribonuclease M5)